MEALSDELLLLVFQEVGWEGTVRGATAVCRRWHAISCDDSLWRFFFHSRYPSPKERATDSGDWKGAFIREATVRRWWQSLSFTPPPLPYKGLSSIPTAPREQTGSEIRLVVLGCPGTGKTCLTVQYCVNHFIERWDPNIGDSYRKRVMLDGTARVLDILDTAGNEEFSALRPQWIQSSAAFLVVYSATSFASFRRCEEFIKEVLQVKEEPAVVPVVMVENKIDLRDEREVPPDAGPAAAQAMGCFFARVSCKTREGVDEAMLGAARLALAITTGKILDAASTTTTTRTKKNKKSDPCLLA